MPAVIGDVEPGTVFVPFHYGYWDEPGRARAANELTLPAWDPVSKQPYFKHAAVRVRKAGKKPVEPAGPGVKAVRPARMHVADYIGMLRLAEDRLAAAYDDVAKLHAAEPDVHALCTKFGSWCQEGSAAVQPFVAKYGVHRHGEPERLDAALHPRLRPGTFGLVRDLHDLALMAEEAHVCLLVLDQAAKGLRDTDLQGVLERLDGQTRRQKDWLRTKILQASPQALVVPE